MDTKLPGASNSNYAYALDDPYEQTIDGTKYTFIKAWDGTKEVTFKSEVTTPVSPSVPRLSTPTTPMALLT